MLKVYLVVVQLVSGQIQHSQPMQVASLEVCRDMMARVVGRGVPEGAEAAGAACFVSHLNYGEGPRP